MKTYTSYFVLLKDIQDALGTSEAGAALVDVARAAHDAERRLAGPLYLAHWATDNDFYAEKDDSSLDNVADMACPMGIIVRDLEPATIQRLLSHVSGNIKAVDEEDFPSNTSWDHVKKNNFFNQWNLCDERGDVYAVLIVRKEETVL